MYSYKITFLFWAKYINRVILYKFGKVTIIVYKFLRNASLISCALEDDFSLLVESDARDV